MDQEAQPAIPLLHAVPDLHGYRVDLRLRLAADQRPADRAIMDRLYASIPGATRLLRSGPVANLCSRATVFGNPQGGLKGIIAAAYSLGAILSLPFIGIVNDKYGRRWSIFGGSFIMVIGALIQGFSVNGMSVMQPSETTHRLTGVTQPACTSWRDSSSVSESRRVLYRRPH